jgi:hypothetical protein
MKTPRIASLLLPLAVLLINAPSALADGDEAPDTAGPFKPKAYDLSRYSPNFDKKSPFEFDPPPPVTEAPTNNFDGVSLGGYCGSGNTLSVYIIVGKEKKRITVYGDGSPFKKRDESGFRIVSLNRGKSLSTTTVVLEKGGQQGTVSFEKETLASKGGGAQGGQIQMVPDGKGGMVPRPVIPRPTGAPGAQTQAYQPPPVFIPGQSNAGGNPGGQNNQIQAQQAANLNNQQLMNQMVNNPNIPQQPVVNPGQNGGAQPPTPPRRRVVLPTQNP